MYTSSLAVPKVDAHVVDKGPRLLPGFFLFLCGLVLMLRLVPPAGPVVCAGLMVYACRGPKQTIQALTLLAFLIIVNKGVAPINISIFRWLILFAAFGRTLWDSIFQDAPIPPILRPLLLFSFTIVFLALLVSYLPTVSILKAVSFAIGVGTVLTGFHRTAHLREYWMSWLVTLGLFILLASLPLYGMNLGYLRNGTGFQGILNHPQTYGPVMAPMTALLTGLILFQANRSRPVLLGAALGWIAIYTSLSRTAFLAIVGSFILTVLIGSFKSQTWRPTISRAMSKGITLFILGVACLFIVLRGAMIQERVMDFLLKGDAADSITESLQSARSVLIERSINNFLEAPITGIGFGIDSDPEGFRVDTGPLGLPVGASVEKGFMPSAVLEETGITGAVLLILFLLSLMRPVLSQDNIAVFWMLLGCLMVNAGEMVFFSVGGNGLYFWIVMGFGYTYSVAESRTR